MRTCSADLKTLRWWYNSVEDINEEDNLSRNARDLGCSSDHKDTFSEWLTQNENGVNQLFGALGVKEGSGTGFV